MKVKIKHGSFFYDGGTPAKDDIIDVPKHVGESWIEAEMAEKEDQGDPEPRATPKAHERAQELGVDLASVEGTGAEGRITVEDVQSAAQDKKEARQARRPSEKTVSPGPSETR